MEEKHWRTFFIVLFFLCWLFLGQWFHIGLWFMALAGVAVPLSFAIVITVVMLCFPATYGSKIKPKLLKVGFPAPDPPEKPVFKKHQPIIENVDIGASDRFKFVVLLIILAMALALLMLAVFKEPAFLPLSG